MTNTGESFRAGYVAIIGEPNVGKSTLMNNLLQHKLSIVTPKPQTTRHRILGVLSGETYQIIFLDTPGLLKPKYLLQERMMEFARSAIRDADLVLLLIDATTPGIETDRTGESVFTHLSQFEKSVFLVINKIDLVRKDHLLPIIDWYAKRYPFKEIIPISALTLDGVDKLKTLIINELPEHPPYYPADIISDQSERFFVSEIIREKIFERYRQEIPYSTTVEVIEFKEREGQKDFISAEIYVERDSQKAILIGKKGQALKEIGERARKEIEVFLGRSVFLELHVKVRKDWRNDTAWLKRLGYAT